MKQLISATGAMILLLMLFSQILNLGIINMRLIAFDSQVSVMATKAGEDGFVTEKNKEEFLNKGQKILKIPKENIVVKAPEVKQENGKLMEIEVKVRNLNLIKQGAFWKIEEGRNNVDRTEKRYVYSRAENKDIEEDINIKQEDI